MKDVDKFGCELIMCTLCGLFTPMPGAKLCDGCYELSKRVEHQPDLAMKVLMKLPADKLPDIIKQHNLIEYLRSEEADDVTLVCDNPDFGNYNNAVLCSGFWTDFTERRFEGDTMLDCLRQAADAKKKRS